MCSKIEETSALLLLDLSDVSKRHLVNVARGSFSTKRGEINLSSLVGSEFGTIVKTHLGAPYAALKPTFYDRIMRGIKRQTQIVYPKDAGYIALWLGLHNGMRVFECGAGSGAMTSVLANAVAPDGSVTAYERDERFFKLAKRNVAKIGLDMNVNIFLRDLADGVDDKPYDAAFIDVREPWLYAEQIWQALSGSAGVAFVIPTTNQVQQLLHAIENHYGFTDVNVAETLLRFYKPVSERLRPKDRMVGHTTYIVMARKIILS